LLNPSINFITGSVNQMFGSAWWAVFRIFTRRHIWSFKRCLERMYDLNKTM